ncbi:MAG: SDR family oxidoreductase [Bdellovibrionota bacterium]
MNSIVVTGTSRGIGLEMTRQLLTSGHNVFALARAPLKSFGLMELKEKFHAKLTVSTVDVANDAHVREFAQSLDGGTIIDTVINNAGIYGEDATFEELSLDEVQRTIAVNAVAPMRITRALLPFLTKATNPKLIHITSLMGSIADNNGGSHYGYRMSKAALNMFNKSFSIDYPEITSMVVHPGWVKTDMGGSAAPLEIKDSAMGILALVEKATRDDNGKFFDYKGKSLPW